MGLQTEGIIFLLLAWITILSILGYCYYKVLTDNNNKN
jgi:hypothetical protein